jgi:3-(3-hydroxy-phenyl)propionate hydroxylase
MGQRVHDVAIVGYGPAGALLANLLGSAGLNVVVIEREAEIYPLPRAIHFDGEVMRVFQSAGLAHAVQAISRPGLVGMHFNNAQGETLLIRGGTQARGPHGWASNHYFHQPELEAVLRQGVGRHSNVKVQTQCEVIALAQDQELATLTVKHLTDGSKQVLQARYVVGCDGGRSMVRKHIDTPMQDLGLHQPWLVFDVRLKQAVPTLPDHTVQHCDPKRPMTYCNVTGNRRRFEIMLMPGDDEHRMVQPETLWRLVSGWLRPDQAEIERAVIYTFHSLIATKWRQGRWLLAGDAAHQTPPFLGQGLCAAVRDVANLAWKLNAVIRSHAPDAWLDSYASERLPHVQAFIELAVRLGDIIQTTDPHAAQVRDAKFKAGQPEIFQFPTPRLGPGLWLDSHPLAGQIFPQPDLNDGQALDEAIGLNFAVIARQSAWPSIGADLLQRWREQQVVMLDDRHEGLRQWLDTHQVQGLMLRPDRCIMGVVERPEHWSALAHLLPLAQQPLQVP